VPGKMRFWGRRHRRGFALMEVIVALTILGIAIATIMRSFTLSMAAIRKNDVSTQAFVLAESLLQTLEPMPPGKGTTSGSFEEDGYKYYFWEMKVEEEEIKYRNLKTANRITNLRGYKQVNLSIIYDDGRNKRQVPVSVDLVFPPVERFSYESKFMNELFRQEEHQ